MWPWQAKRTNQAALRFYIEDTFALKAGGTVLAGRLESGHIQVGDTVFYHNPQGAFVFSCVIKAIEIPPPLHTPAQHQKLEFEIGGWLSEKKEPV